MFPKSVAVISPSIGRAQLRRAIQSVQAQTYPEVEHYIVVDGREHAENVQKIVSEAKPLRHPVEVLVLPQNTGLERYHGYRICAGFGYLVNAEVFFFLDDDNWYDADHIQHGVEALEEYKAAWSFSLRRVCSEEGAYLVDDDCDSLGFWRRHQSYAGDADHFPRELQDFSAVYPFLVDTNCYAIRAEVLMEIAPLFVHHRRGDAYVASNLARKHSAACTGRRTVNYEVRKNAEERLTRYFQTGNAAMHQRYRGTFPWHQRQLCPAFDLQRLAL